MPELKSYPVWDIPTRWFHWINVLCVIGLIAIGVVILNAKVLGVTSDGKVTLKVVHVWIGYVFATNLLWRFIWAFIGNRYARWREIVPGGVGYWRSLSSYVASLAAGRRQQFLGHNPLARISVSVLFLLLTIQAVSGLVLAGTDIFFLPIGPWIAEWVAAPGIDPATLKPYSPHMYDEAAWESMRAFRKPFITAHYYCFYALALMIVLHIVAVVVTELKEGGGIVSAMFTGRKVLDKKPEDAPREEG
jgi:Ni/Fe-hydrogenase 1 B-type cytochrome subunit